VRLSRARVNHWSRLLVEALDDHAEVRLLRDPNSVRLAIIGIIEEELRRDEYYRQYYREEFDRYRPVR